MNTELFATQWQTLKEERQQLINESEQLKQKLSLLTEEQGMKKLLEEKSHIKRNVDGLRKNVESYRKKIDIMNRILSDRKGAETNRQLAQRTTILLNKRKFYLVFLRKNNVEKERIENQERLIWELEAPLDQVEQYFRKQIFQEECHQQTAQQVLDEALARIAIIEEHYRQTRRCLEEGISEVQRKQDQHREKMKTWAIQDRTHLEWVLEHNGHLNRDELVKAYQQRFPDDDVSSLLPKPVASVRPQVVGARIRTRKVAPTAVVDAPKDERLWGFMFVTSEHDSGTTMPADKRGFVDVLRRLLGESSTRGVDVALVYEKLVIETRRIDQGCATSARIMGDKFHNWMKARVGSDYRVLMSPNQQTRQLRFFLYPKKDHKLVLA